jgi:hypothetical protein
MRELRWSLIARNAWAENGTVVAGKTNEADRRVLRQPLCWRTRQLRSLFWPLFAWSALAQPATVLAGTTGEGADLASYLLVGVGPAILSGDGRKDEGAALASVRSVGEGSAKHCVGGHDS